MPAPLAHFAIHADDVDRARSFYEQVFGWTFDAWGPPDFFKIDTGADENAPIGALQARRALDDGGPTRGFECTIAVDDVQSVTAAATSAGGKILMEPTTITGVGELVFVEDTEGNIVGAMRYDADAE